MLLPILLTAGALVGAGGATATRGPVCPRGQGARALTASTLCLINRTRVQQDRHRLRLDRRLTTAARGHSRDMVAHHYFAHVSRSGRSSADRVAETGWMRGRTRWMIGENLAWRTGPASARAIVRAWLRSRPHRHVLLRREYRVIGIGITRGTPFSVGDSGWTYTADFGT
jgi:uncharacterized protein YkwD